MTLLIVAGVGVFSVTAWRRWRLMRLGPAEARWDRPGERLRRTLRFAFGQARMPRYRLAGIGHILIFAGFFVLLIRTIILFGRAYDPEFSLLFFHESSMLGAAYGLVKEIVALGVLVGVGIFIYYRVVVRLRRMSLGFEGLAILLLIAGLMVSDFVYEGCRLARAGGAAGPVVHAWLPVGSALARWWWSPEGSWWLETGQAGGLWAHSVIVLVFLNVLPYTKHFHILTAIPNVYFQDLGPAGRLRPIEDLEGRVEREETLGVARITDLHWKSVLDLYSCTECGRCSDQCPATNTGKRLSPKHFTIDLRDFLYDNAASLLRERAASEAGRRPIVPEVIAPEVIWACTTCRACEVECPVFITYVDKIVDIRRHLVMERSEFPEQLQTAFRGLESTGNPYNAPPGDRVAWAEGLDVPRVGETAESPEYLLWVGCAPAFDNRARGIVQATARLLKRAGVRFAILGEQEQCTGDPARRAGNEFLFQMLAEANVAVLNEAGVRRIVTACPHCYNMLKNEYPDFGGRYEVFHHTEVLADLVSSGRLRPTGRIERRVVFHDSCYLGRYNDIYDAPRRILDAIPGVERVEVRESRDRGMCCGAGGAQMWKEEEPGDVKVNYRRAEQLRAVSPEVATSACPFCLRMLADAWRDRYDEQVVQRDVAELLAEAVEGREAERGSAVVGAEQKGSTAG